MMRLSGSRGFVTWLRDRLGRVGPFPFIVLLFMLSLPLVLQPLALVSGIDNVLSEWRAKQAPRAASGKFAFLAIDKKSLDAVGIWPWPRTVYADLLDRISSAGVNDIFVDIDFSARSTDVADRRLAQALENAGGGVILPVFLQHAEANVSRGSMALSEPLPLLAQNAWLATANVRPDADARVRRFPMAEDVGGQSLPSVPAVLAGTGADMSGAVTIDFSIDPATVLTVSVADILSGAVPASVLGGRSVVIGAFATELKDVFAVPVHGTISGPMLHLLAAETLVQKRALRTLDSVGIALTAGLAITGLLILLRRRKITLGLVLGCLALSAFVAETAAFALQTYAACILPTGLLHLVIAAGAGLSLFAALDLSHWLARLARIQTRNSERLLQQVIRDSLDAVIVIDSKARVIKASQTTSKILGADLLIVPTTDFVTVAPAALATVVSSALEAYRADRSIVFKTIEIGISVSGSPRILECRIAMSALETNADDIEGAEDDFVACITVRDMTLKRTYESRLEYLSEYDERTGVLHRGAFARHMESDTDRRWVVCAVNLYRFAVVNATLGRDVGDGLLRAAAERLSEINPAIRHVGRLGSDVFCVAADFDMLAQGGVNAEGFAEMLLTAFEKPFVIQQSTVSIGVRVGICEARADVSNASEKIEYAEIALEEARRSAGAGYRLYDPVSAGKRARLRSLEADLRGALTRGEFFLVFQPQVDLASGRVIGAEALVRWQHPRLGIVSPLDFISVAEANGFINELGLWVLGEACRAAAAWPGGSSVAVNVSPIQFSRGDVARAVREVLAETGLPANRLQIEITETVFLKVTEALIRQLQELRSMGVEIALDDFGTGYSSLSYIAKFPCDKIKIDQSFVRNLVTDSTSRALVQSVMALASGLGLKALAEGIEDEEQRSMLSLLGCQEGQGYLFGKPVAADVFAQDLALQGDRRQA